MPNGVFGTSEAAYVLANAIPATVQGIEESLKKISSQAQIIKDSWEAKDNGNIDEMVSSIKSAIDKSMENVDAVEKAIIAYADFLASHGM